MSKTKTKTKPTPADHKTTAAGTPKAAAGPATAPAKRVPKRDTVLALIRRKGGASLAELNAATGWQAHSVRALICGLRKAGQTIIREGRGPDSCYRIEEPAR